MAQKIRDAVENINEGNVEDFVSAAREWFTYFASYDVLVEERMNEQDKAYQKLVNANCMLVAKACNDNARSHLATSELS